MANDTLTRSYTWKDKNGKFRTRQGHRIAELMRSQDKTGNTVGFTDVAIVNAWIKKVTIHKVHK